MQRLLVSLLALALIGPPGLPAAAKQKCSGTSCTSTKAKPVHKKAAKKPQSPSEDARSRYFYDTIAFCKKRYGSPSRVWKIDYTHHLVWCEPPSY